MQTADTVIRDAASADGYDEQAKQTNWLGPDVVFGLAYEFIHSGESLLDVGIGSGLSSIPFHKAGLRIFGLDASSEVLRVCAAKSFAEDLKLHDLRELPLPYPDSSFRHLIAVAVLNSFRDLGPLMREFARIMDGQGILAFTVEDQKPGQAASYPINPVEVNEQPQEGSAVMLYRHSEQTICELLESNHFTVLKSLEFVAFHYPAEDRDVLFKAYVARQAQA